MMNLTHREHYIAHLLLHETFKGTSQSTAFFNMSNIQKKTNSRAYEESRIYHKHASTKANKNPIRNEKISQALSGKPKSEAHKQKLIGHVVTTETREKLRSINTGKKLSSETKIKMSMMRTGKSKQPHSEEGKKNISNSRKIQQLKWFNNGILSSQFSSAPDDTWSLGRLKSPTKNMKWFNDGTTSKMFSLPPDDTWVVGRLKLGSRTK
jgi:hypothetical protein